MVPDEKRQNHVVVLYNGGFVFCLFQIRKKDEVTSIPLVERVFRLTEICTQDIG